MKTIKALTLFFFFAALPAFAAPDLRHAALSSSTVSRFSPIELTLDLPTAYANPFDPDEIIVAADFVSPTGKKKHIEGFWNQNWTRSLEAGKEKWTAAGTAHWTIRFTPDEAGNWNYDVTARDKTGVKSLKGGAFRVVKSSNPGFVRRAKMNPAAFALDDGSAYFAVGENLCWGNERGTYNYDDWLGALGKANANWIRVWMCSWNCGLEWTGAGYHGLGIYRLDNAAKLDKILAVANQNNVRVMLCLGTFGEITTGGFFNEGDWKNNPYNAANGGPCATPAEYWTSPIARKFYRQRLRYILSRWGALTQIQSWEFWNEANAPADWIAEMARFVKSNDPYKHLLTTTYGDPAVWKLAEIDFTQTHSYGTGNLPDHAPVVHEDARQNAIWGKPHLVGEFGIDYRKDDSPYDPMGLGVNLHNALWAATLSGDAGGAMIWWWDSYVAPKNLYGEFAALRRFADTIPWASGRWTPLEFDPTLLPPGPETFGDVTIPATFGWGKSPSSLFLVAPDGRVSGGALGQYLYSVGKPDLRTTPTFQVDFLRSGRLIIHVSEVSDRADLRVSIDGKIAATFALSASPPADSSIKPDYKSTQNRPEYNNYLAVFDRDFSVDVPAGPHSISLDASGGDWLSFQSVTLTNYRSLRYSPVTIYGVKLGRQAAFWAQNTRHNWQNVLEKTPTKAVDGAEMTACGLPEGRYEVTWIDTKTGRETGKIRAFSAGGRLTVPLPTLATDVAARVRPIPPASKPATRRR